MTDLKYYIGGAVVGAVPGAFLAFGTRSLGNLPWILFGCCVLLGFIVAFLIRSVKHAFTPKASRERGQLTIGDLVGYGLLAGLFVLAVANLQFINDFGAGVEGMIMLGYSSNAVDQYQGYYKALPCAGTTCNVTPANFTNPGDSSSTVLPYTPTVWGDATGQLSFTDTSVAGGVTSYAISVPRQFDTRVIHILASSTYAAGDTRISLISGQGVTAER